MCSFGWHASAADIVASLGGQSGQTIVIDLKPTVAQNVSLYLLRDVWGYSAKDWTPLALRLECLFVDRAHSNPMKFKAAFDDAGADGTLIGEFLIVVGTTQRYNTNGTLDTTFGSGGIVNMAYSAVAVQPDGRIDVSGPLWPATWLRSRRLVHSRPAPTRCPPAAARR